ncbi:hypothetical protein [Cellulomonas palmilytica]|uniref:hypothetical protein n=1 Tax=Cellulomonas palmilytica TaxID=2608402 RepID=UPI001F1E45FA|nr:hypothetical protein [Cellulomonas palmilytica]UJP39285.1 hypothetical protein F1D97_13175 [Cellulomonas palmilytica]
MTRASSAPARLARAVALSVLVVALATVGHGLGGGLAPQPGLVVALVALSLPVTVLVCGRPVGRVVALAVLGVGQLLLHGAFSVVGSCGASVVDVGAHAHHGGTHLQHACAAGVDAAGGSLVSGSGMLAWHVLATLATALVVAGVERGVRHVAAVLAPLFRAPAALVAPVLVRMLPADEPDLRVASLHLRGTPARRGPPGVAFPPTGTPRT